MKNKKEVKKKATGLLSEFKTFVLRGNVMDLAVGVLIGAAFQGLVTSLTNNIISPILGSLSKVNFNQFALKIGNLNLTYGAFLTDVINFIIMAFVIFILVKGMNFISKIGEKTKEEKEVKKEEKQDESIILLKEIRDLLKEKKKNGKNSN